MFGMTRTAQVLVGVLAFLALTAGAFAVGSATSYDDPPPPREIVVDEVATDPSPSTDPSARPARAPRERSEDRAERRGDDDGRVEVVTPRPQPLDDDDDDDDGGDDDDDDDDGDDDD